ncbi:Aste57867_23930 [Aphanomyces stellatus]|uniref:Aste57867_23930 protein n=1 Tax=Aphanomyces stellatus TaxID=120398 RepID=A0A485LPT4_9STRA|nr:hypothetical protein As57867_023857 [Aphanomyces stellatus]VFU00573.1 Aste57867_23930 [Aphanomyces stellatus]
MLQSNTLSKYQTFSGATPTEPLAHPLTEASCLSKLAFGWVQPLLALGNRRQFAPEDLWPVRTTEKTSLLAKRFAAAYYARGQSILGAFFSIYWCQLFWLGLLQLFSVACDLYGPGFVLGQVIASLEAPMFDKVYVLQLVASLVGSSVLNAFATAHMNNLNTVIGIQVAAALQSMVFDKSLKLSSKAKTQKSAGEIVSVFTADIQTITNLTKRINPMWITPIQLGFVLHLLWGLVGWATLSAFAVMFVLGFVSAILASVVGSQRRQILTIKDSRMKVLTELFGAIQIIKFNAWEDKFRTRVEAIRTREVDSLWMFYKAAFVLITLMESTPIVVTVAVFATYTLWMQQNLTVTVVFATIALLKVLQSVLNMLPFLITGFVQALVSIKRVSDILHLDERNPANVLTPASDRALAHTHAMAGTVVAIADGSFGWDVPLFQGLHLTIQQGAFVVVHGAVGQGKSTLCSILVGECAKLTGSVFVGGDVAYFTQQPWIQNTTVRENILFGKPYDRVKYNKVLDACALTTDVASFPAGDRTELGAKGINLSGGQKARVALARACYSDADIFVLDAPLAAVDAIVANEIFTKCFLGLLRHKTIVLVTHNPEIIASPDVDRVLEVKDGSLVESSSVDTNPRGLRHATAPLVAPLNARKPIWDCDETNAATTHREYDGLVTPTATTPYSFGDSDMLFTPKTANDTSFQEDGKLVMAEERAQGQVSKVVVSHYLQAIGGLPAILVVVVSTLAMQLLKVASDMWMSRWGAANDVANGSTTMTALNDDTTTNMVVYTSLAMGSCLIMLLQSVSVFRYTLRGSQSLFLAMLTRLLHAPMSFFDTTPIGRILNRFGSDVMMCDFTISMALLPVLNMVSNAIVTLGTASVLMQWFGLFFVPLVLVYGLLTSYYLAPLREMNRIQTTTRSPLLSFVAEGIDGSETIRAFGDKYIRRFVRLQDQKIELYVSAQLTLSAVNQWFSLRIQLLSAAIVGCILVAIIVLRESLGVGAVGLLLTYGLTVPPTLATIVNMWANLESAMVGPERLVEYASVEQEGHPSANVTAPLTSWPSRGDVTFDNVSFRYKATDPLVLQHVHFHVRGGEKIGIVGRTGAGKSSLMMALFRMNEVASGTIKIDGVDIASLALKSLRSSLAIIPQNPVLFKGTLHSYLDPFDEYTDAQLWAVLQKVQLTDRVGKDDDKLLSQVEENGANFSVGERQMLCMARALLHRAKVVVLDEATAAVDHATDRHLQQLIRTEFAASTVLTIAHRLDTVLDCDRVMVFDQGKLAQCDIPTVLVAQGSGLFFDLVSEGGYMEKVVGN